MESRPLQVSEGQPFPVLARISYSGSLQATLLYIHVQLCFALVCFILSVVGFSFQLRTLVMMHMQSASRLKYSSQSVLLTRPGNYSVNRARTNFVLKDTHQGLVKPFFGYIFIPDRQRALPLHCNLQRHCTTK